MHTANLQGAYYLISGLWPMFSMRSFEAITGRKHDKWLVNTVGALVAVNGMCMLLSQNKKSVVPLAIGSAVALTTIDVLYNAKGRIRKVYLLDAAAEIALVGGWVLNLMCPSKQKRSKS